MALRRTNGQTDNKLAARSAHFSATVTKAEMEMLDEIAAKLQLNRSQTLSEMIRFVHKMRFESIVQMRIFPHQRKAHRERQ